MPMLIVEGTIRVPDVNAARPIMTRMIEASRAEPGCIEYVYAVDLLDPTLVRISERWTTRAALAAHAKASHLAEWRSHWPQLRITDRSLRLYEGEPEVI
jgi:quinol monooxygenase YgiN